jgi:ribonuclease Y
MKWLPDIQWARAGGLVVLGGAIGLLYRRWRDCLRRSAMEVSEQDILAEARREADRVLGEARLAANEESIGAHARTEAAFAGQRHELDELEQRLTQRERLINQQLEGLLRQEQSLREQQAELQGAKAGLAATQAQADALLGQRREQLQKLAHLAEADARALLLKELEQEALRDAGDLSRRLVEQAKTKAEEEARRIVGLAIQRYAGEHTFETTTATVALSGDDLKGRIIGREGRNIRAFEAATGVTVLIDDTPNAVVLSGFDPVRREIARQAMERLILDGRIHPTRIEEIVTKVNQEVEGSHALVGAELVKRHGESAEVVNGVAAHHDEVPHTSLLSILVSAADAISASRPGARSESMTTYLKRLENLEKIGVSFPGVQKCYAVQAGRELRVIVQPDRITDQQAYLLARNIARKIEDELQYPGQIRVTVVRETRCVEFAK